MDETTNPVDQSLAEGGAPAPAPAPNPSANVGGENDFREELDDNSGDGQPAQGRKPIQPRINELTRQRHEAQREAAYWRGIAEALRQPQAAPTPVAAPAPTASQKPQKAQFENYDEYMEALTEWKAGEIVRTRLEEVNRQQSERTQRQTAAQQETARTQNWQTRQTAAMQAMPDYQDVVGNSDVPIARHVGDLLLDSEHGPALAYQLAKNPELADKLNGMTERQAAMHIGRLEAALQAAAPAPAPAPTNAPAVTAPAPLQGKVSKAPAPPNSVNGGRGASTTPDMSKLSMDEYVKVRKAQGAAWGR